MMMMMMTTKISRLDPLLLTSLAQPVKQNDYTYRRVLRWNTSNSFRPPDWPPHATGYKQPCCFRDSPGSSNKTPC